VLLTNYFLNGIKSLSGGYIFIMTKNIMIKKQFVTRLRSLRTKAGLS